MAKSGNEVAEQVDKEDDTSKSPAEDGSPPAPEQDVPLKDTVVPFTSPLQPLREPALVTSKDDDPHVLGPQILGFANKEKWEHGLVACERVATGQCETGARMGCSVTAARRCQPNWLQRLPFLKKKSTPESMKEREQCETREFDTCLAKASQKCAEHAQKLCGDVYRGARIAGKDDVMLITDWEDDDETSEYHQLQTGEKVISSSKGAPWMPPALGKSIESQVPEEGDTERRRSGGKAETASGGLGKDSEKQGGNGGDEEKESLWSVTEKVGAEHNSRASKTGGEKGQRRVTGKDGVAYRVVRIGGRTGPDGKPLRALQSLKDGSLKFLDADGRVKTLAERSKGSQNSASVAGGKGR